MTNTSTMDTQGSVEQCIRIIKYGADLVRLTAINTREAENLANIKKELRKRGFNTPLVADVHFNPKVAETAARIVEKIRINPGNFVPPAFDTGMDSIREKLVPLIHICKEHGTAIRIGVNHGSLSKRILEEYGDNPEGMVRAAMEYLQVCRDQDFHQIIFSMKSSNTRVMVQAYRLLFHEMIKSESLYPLHLGVTEAGEGEDGRIKSAVGIGTLMADGLGDTIRISLTEDPEIEVPVGKKLARYYENLTFAPTPAKETGNPFHPFTYRKRITEPVLNMGGTRVPVVISDVSTSHFEEKDLGNFGFTFNKMHKTMERGDLSPDGFYLGDKVISFTLPEDVYGLVNSRAWKKSFEKNQIYPVFSPEEYPDATVKSGTLNFVMICTNGEPVEIPPQIHDDPTLVYIFESSGTHAFHDQRKFAVELIKKGQKSPVIFKHSYVLNDPEELQLMSAADFGGLFMDGLSDGIWLDSNNLIQTQELLSLSFGILQASRVRISKTEYISCPSCGRTLFDIQKITAKIREKTKHLKGLKIGVMGCIVNGPGEMADADYGYVGSGPGKITLYKNFTPVKKNLPVETAVEELIQLIKENGDWVENRRKR
jgi:(E)-4-hydroxy-3-methylbut-2-enyl-diphosphate synthase